LTQVYSRRDNLGSSGPGKSLWRDCVGAGRSPWRDYVGAGRSPSPPLKPSPREGIKAFVKTPVVNHEENTMAQTYIGASIRRREDLRFLTGKATFVDDIKLPHMLYAAILRSTHAHARVTAIETSEALAMPGVVAVLTWRDIAPYAQPIPIRL